MIHRRHALLAAVCLATCVLAGCGGSDGLQPEGPTGTVTGKATRKGAPLTSGTVTFSSPQQGLAFMGAIGSDGSYSLSGPFGNAVPAGEYQVAIAPAQQGGADPMALMQQSADGQSPVTAEAAAGEIPLKFRSPDLSGITKTVAAGANDIAVDIPE